MQRDMGWTQDVGTFGLGVTNVWESLKTDLTCTQLMVLTTVEKVLNLSRDYWFVVMTFENV